MTARRERNNLLVPGVGSASNTLRPPNSRSRPSSRNHLYSLSGGSSSSLLPGQADRDGSSGAAQGAGGDTSHLEAPYLTTAETHLGRVTLTAPDNMRRRREEEREKRAKAKRKKKAQATAAATALAGGPQAGPSSRPITPMTGPSNAAANPSSSRRSAESRTLQATPQPARPTSAMEARQRRRAASRSNSVGSTQSASAVVERGGEAAMDSAIPPEGTAQAPASDPAAQSLAEAAMAEEIASISSAHQASLRRHNIYASLSEIAPGLSDDEADPDDLPPPFPEGATRPRSPPQPPGEPEGPNGTWTEAQIRQQEEAERCRVPDSPPPAFRSDDEEEAGPHRGAAQGAQGQDATAPATVDEPSSSSESEAETAEVAADRRAWEDDLAAGLSLEERIARERERREARERISIGLAVLQARARRGLVEGEEQSEEETAEETMEAATGLPRETPEFAAVASPVRPEPVGSLPASSLPRPQEAAPAVAARDGSPAVSETPTSAATPAPTAASSQPSTPAIVTAAPTPAPPSTASPAVPAAPAAAQRPAPTMASPGPPAPAAASTSTAAPRLSTQALPRKVQVNTHRRTVSDGRAGNANAAGQASRLVDQANHRPKPTQVRARPASESHSRFRDDATAAAERRRKLWAGVTSGQFLVPVATPFLPQSSTGEAPPVATAVFDAPMAGSRPRSPSTASEPSDADSSSSELEWQKEAAAFEALRRSAERRTVVETDSESEDDVAVPGRFRGRRDSLDIGQVQAPVPRAPPPLVLGRSRGGGAAYSSSSESSDEDDGRLYSSSEDEAESQRPESGLEAPQPISLAELRARSRRIALDSGTEPATSPEPDSRHGSSWHSHRDGGLTRSDSTTSSHSSQAPFVADDGQDATIAELVARRFGGPPPPKPADKGKAPVRPHDWLLSPSASASSRPEPVAAQTAHPQRAGSFVADTGSSDDDESSSDEANKTVRQPPVPSNGRAPPLPPPRNAVQNRLRGLFDAPLAGANPESTASAAAARATVDRLFSTPLLEPTSRPKSGLSRRSSGRSGDGSVTDEDATRALKPAQPPAEQHRTSSAALQYPPRHAHPAANMNEDDARDSALRDIAALRARASGQQDGLTALERLLIGGGNRGFDTAASARPLPEPPSANPRRASLTRSGAIVQRYPPPRSSAEAYSRPGARPASFVNPRSVNAPRPLGRLPTITDATRHFPRARDPAPVTESPQDDDSLMAQIPASEHTGLQRPLEPTRTRVGPLAAQTADRPMPALPPRPAGGVSAMISRFEAVSGPEPPRSYRMSMPVGPSRPAEQPSNQAARRPEPRQTIPETQRQDALARRPPPPPPVPAPAPSSQRSSLLEPEPPTRATFTPSPRTQAMQALTSGAPVDSRPPTSPFLPPPPNAQLGASLAAGGAARAARDRGAAIITERPDRSISPMGLGLALDQNGRAAPARQDAAFPALPFAPRVARPLPTPPQVPSSPPQRRAPPSPPAPRPLARPLEDTSPAPQVQPRPRVPTNPASHTNGARPAPAAISPETSDEDETTPAADAARPSMSRLPSTARAPSTRQSTDAGPARRQPSLGITDLDLLASRLEAEGAHYDEITALAEFLGPAKDTRATAEEMAALPVGRVEVESRRVTKDGKVKTRLSVVGVRVDRCAICLLQFKAEQMACLFPCMHVFHEPCATRLLRETRNCPTCRRSIAD